MSSLGEYFSDLLENRKSIAYTEKSIWMMDMG